MDHFLNHNMSGHSGAPDPKKIVAYEVVLKGKKQIAKGTYAFSLEKPKEFNFKAGQHIRMTLINPPETDSEGNSRFLSLASTPQEKELVIAMRMRNSAFKRVLRRMQIGDKVKIEMRLDNPHGSFTLHEDSSKPAVFISGGIGIVPAFSMIKDALERKLSNKIFLFYANRRPEDAPFLDELQDLVKKNLPAGRQGPSFKLIATMTEPEKSAKPWRGEIGFINQSMLKKYVNNLESPIYYIAGLSEMVSAMKTLIKNSGVNEDNIRAEEFDGFTMNHNNDVKKPMWKNHLPPIAIALVIIVVVTLHAGAGISIYKSGLGVSLNNPISYFIIGISIVIAAFKLKHLLGFIHSKKK